MAWKTFPLELRAARMVTPHVRHLVFQRLDGEPLEYKAGQFINIHFEHDGKALHRSYSVANPPGEGIEIEIAVSPVEDGRATRLLFGLEEGDRIEASGPYGRFVLREDPPCKLWLVATGTGVTPYRSMLPLLHDRLEDPAWEVSILLGVQRRDELLYGYDFREFAGQHERAEFFGCYSREMPAEARDDEREGYVQEHLTEFGPVPGRDIVYLCGNPNMIDDAFQRLRDAGFETRAIRREKYLSARD